MHPLTAAHHAAQFLPVPSVACALTAGDGRQRTRTVLADETLP